MPKKDNPHGLTDKQEMFCREYLIDLNATQAAIRAGYSEKSAHSDGPRMLANADIQKRLQGLKEARSEEVGMSAESVLKDIIEIQQRCMQSAPVTNRKGDQIQDEAGNNLWRFDARNALKASELLGKHVDLFNQHNRSKSGDVVDLTKLTDDEIVTVARLQAKAKSG